MSIVKSGWMGDGLILYGITDELKTVDSAMLQNKINNGWINCILGEFSVKKRLQKRCICGC